MTKNGSYAAPYDHSFLFGCRCCTGKEQRAIKPRARAERHSWNRACGDGGHPVCGCPPNPQVFTWSGHPGGNRGARHHGGGKGGSLRSRVYMCGVIPCTGHPAASLNCVGFGFPSTCGREGMVHSSSVCLSSTLGVSRPCSSTPSASAAATAAAAASAGTAATRGAVVTRGVVVGIAIPPVVHSGSAGTAAARAVPFGGGGRRR